MKRILLFLTVFTISVSQLHAQDIHQSIIQKANVNVTQLPIVYLNHDVTVHFTSPEPIQYVDISSPKIIGDLPVKNVLRIRHIDTIKNGNFPGADNAVLTVVGEKFIAQYQIIYAPMIVDSAIHTNIEIKPGETRPLDVPGVSMSQKEMQKFAQEMLSRSPKIHAVASAAYDIKEKLNNVYSLGDYVFLDISFENKTNLKYDIDEIRFKVDDKYVTKATSVQSIEIKPDYIFATNTSFKKHFRNVYVFKKFTFPGNKVLNVEMTEKQLSGRVITMQVDYSDILNADTL